MPTFTPTIFPPTTAAIDGSEVTYVQLPDEFDVGFGIAVNVCPTFNVTGLKVPTFGTNPETVTVNVVDPAR